MALLLAAGCSGDATPATTSSNTIAPPATITDTTTTTITDTTTTQPMPEAEYADWVFVSGRVLTMDPTLGTAEAVAVTGDTVTAVGTESEVRQLIGPETIVVDLQGSTLMPGFVDTHSHFFGYTDPVTAQDEMLAFGITTTAELGVDSTQLAALRQLEADGDLRVRLNAYLSFSDNCGGLVGDWYLEHPVSTPPGGHLWISGVKLFADGGSCGRPATTFATGAGNGDLYFNSEELTEIFEQADADGYQIAVHALGDRAMTEVLDAFDAAFGGPRPLRHRIEHNALVSEAFAGRYDRAGVTGTIFGAYPTCFFIGEFGNFDFATPPPFDEWEWHWRRLIDGNPGTVFGWSTDHPVFEDSSPIGSLFGLVTRRQARADGTHCEPGPAQIGGAVTIDEALQLMTTNAAFILHREEEVGSIKPGKLADLVILTDDPREVPPAELLNMSVIFTMVGGSPEYCTDVFGHLCG